MTTKTTHSEEQAKAQLASIREMVAALECDYRRLAELCDEREAWEPPTEEEAETRAQTGGVKLPESWAEANPDDAAELAELEAAAGGCDDADEARQRIEEDALSVQVRGGWHNVGEKDDGPVEFEILLCTGGPAVRIMGELDDNNEPDRAWLEHRDWGTPWTHYYEEGSQETLLTYARCFLFGQ